MVKPIDNIVTEIPLRDIRLASPEEAPGGTNGNGHAPVAEEVLVEREQAGYERGRHEAAQEYEAQLQTLRGELENTRVNGVSNLLANLEQDVQQQLSRGLRDMEAGLIEFSTEAAIKLVNGLPITTEIVEAAIREAIGQAEQDASLRVRVHPDDLAMLQQEGSDLLNDSPHRRAMQFIVDPDIDRGGCVVETDCGVIDGRRETRIELLKQAVTE